MTTYTEKEIEKGIGCFTTQRTTIYQLSDGPHKGRFATCGSGEYMGSSAELVGYAHPKKNGIDIKWL